MLDLGQLELRIGDHTIPHDGNTGSSHYFLDYVQIPLGHKAVIASVERQNVKTAKWGVIAPRDRTSIGEKGSIAARAMVDAGAK